MKIILFVVLTVMIFGLTPAFAEEKIITVGPNLVECMGMYIQQCMQIKESSSDSWENFYDQIVGFDYEEGYIYTLRVIITEIENPPADASSLEYTLLDMIDKMPEEDVSVENASFWENHVDLLVSPVIGKTIYPDAEHEAPEKSFIVRDIKNDPIWHISLPEIEGLDYVEGNTYLISAKKHFTIPIIEPAKYELIELKQVFKSHKPYNNNCVPGYHIWVDGDCEFAFRCSENAYPGKLCVTNMVIQDYLRPLQQEKVDISPEDVICLETLRLVINSDNKPACVEYASLNKLLDRGFILGNNNNDSPYN